MAPKEESTTSLVVSNGNGNNATSGQRSNKSAMLVKQLRQRFLDSYEMNKYEDVYDDADIRLVNDDWYLKRFLLANNRDVEAAFKMLDDTMRWRNDMFISQIRDYHFPCEFYKIGGLFPYEQDKKGNLVMYMRVRMHHKVPELEEPIKGFLVHNFNKTEKLCRGQGFALVFDLTGLSYSNVDLPFLSFLISFGGKHFPGSLVYILVYNLPWLFSAMQKVVFSMLSEEATGIIKFAKGDQIFEYIDPENVPDYIPGGTCQRNYRAVAPGSKPILDLVTAYGYTRETYDRLYPQFKKDLDEAEEVLSTKTYIDPPPDFFDDMTGTEWAPLPLPSKRVRQPKKRPLESQESTIESFEPLSPVDGGVKRPFVGGENVEELFKKCRPSTDASGATGLSIFPSDVLSFSTSDGNSGTSNNNNYTCDLDLRNNTSNLMAYNILSTNPKCYRVAPYKGILPPSTSIRVTIVNVSINGPGLKDKFRVDCTPVQVPKMSATEFRKLWLPNNKKSITTYKLTTSVAVVDSSDVADSSILTSYSGMHGPQSLLSEYDIDTSGISSSPSSVSKPATTEAQLKMLNSRIRNLETKYSRLITITTLLFMITFALLFILVIENTCGLNSVLPMSMVSSNVQESIGTIKDEMCKLAATG